MKLQLKIDNCGTGYKLITPTEEIEGVDEAIFPEWEKYGFQSVLVRFALHRARFIFIRKRKSIIGNRQSNKQTSIICSKFCKTGGQ